MDQVYFLFLDNRCSADGSYLHLEPPDDREVVSLMDLDKSFLNDIAAHELQSFKRHMGKLKRGLLWVTVLSILNTKILPLARFLGLPGQCARNFRSTSRSLKSVARALKYRQLQF